ncbi:SOS-response transcriptional repressor LexA (RecA-mediated autopeptidase) (LexA) [Fructobacillus fructosus]|uniref:SOS-response transcriptional repressor LexA (RecA-mediated autopeptidase) (LexA) n=1 Tax=Fructobacillus fructosus TaxID=1631 RepID=A0ABM9MZ87_9LACO|nr:SOS-response transcriptional repressor LexA (RecA-mediated autopeptidase) (LexA) [Fructobacillus fructosus]
MVDGVEFGRKIKEIREAKHMSVRQVAIKADMSHSYLSTIENGRRDTIPSKKTLLKMAHGLNMSQNDIFKVAGFLPENIPNELPISSKPSTVSIPIYGRISAGYPEGAKEDIDGEIDVPNRISNRYSSDELIALRVNGESMNKVIPNGAVAILAKIDKCDITNGDICGVIIDGEAATLKHVYQYPDRIRFEPDSWLKEEFKPFEYNKEDVENGQPPIQIIGKLVHQQSSF